MDVDITSLGLRQDEIEDRLPEFGLVVLAFLASLRGYRRWVAPLVEWDYRDGDMSTPHMRELAEDGDATARQKLEQRLAQGDAAIADLRCGRPRRVQDDEAVRELRDARLALDQIRDLIRRPVDAVHLVNAIREALNARQREATDMSSPHPGTLKAGDLQ